MTYQTRITLGPFTYCIEQSPAGRGYDLGIASEDRVLWTGVTFKTKREAIAAAHDIAAGR